MIQESVCAWGSLAYNCGGDMRSILSAWTGDEGRTLLCGMRGRMVGGRGCD